MPTRYDENNNPIDDQQRAHATPPGHVPTEEHVPNEAKVLPTSRMPVLFLSAVSAILAIATVVAGYAWGMIWAGLFLAVLATLAGAAALLMAWDDARVGRLLPSLATITAAILLTIVAMDLAGADDAIERADPQRAIVADPAPDPDGDRAQPAAGQD